MNRKQRRAFRFVRSVINGGQTDVRVNGGNAKTTGDCCEGVCQSYDIYSNKGDFLKQSPKWFGGDIAVVSLGQKNCVFSLAFNHNEFEILERKARRLYNMAQAMMAQRQKNEKSM
ncbi:MAG: hypothetical protein J6T57_02155 [Alphaproteobacteria bacterium]|nr:hypothetical protein [Alphaproteobacteria bacterium]